MDDKGFVESSELHVVVPQDTGVGIDDLFTHELGEYETSKSKPSLGVEQRSLLHFDELLSVYLVLRTPYQDEAPLKSRLSRLTFNLEARSYGSAPPPIAGPEANVSPTRNEDVIWSGSVDSDKEPLVTIQETDEEEGPRIVLAAWNLAVRLNRPRIRLQSPIIDFKASAILSPGKENIEQYSDPCLPSGVPSSVNLLEPLSHDPTLVGPVPRLTASRLSRVQPLNRNSGIGNRILKSQQPNRFPAVPAISSRVHYTRSKNHAGKASLVASLDIETSPFSNDDIELSTVTMTLSEGSSEDLAGPHRPKGRWICRPKDLAVHLFRLTLNSPLPDGPSSAAGQMVEVTVDATVLVTDICQPRIHMRWKTGVDFSAALNPIYGAPGQSMQRSRRPTSLPVTPGHSNPNTVPVTNREGDEEQPRSPGGPRTRQRAASISDLGVTVTFTAPKKIHVGNLFKWDVLVFNGSSRPRKLAINAIPRRRRDWKGHVAKSSASSIGGVIQHKEGETADAVLDENVLCAMQRNSGGVGEPQSQVLCLSTDVRIGPLNPGACMDAKLEFMPLATGFLQIEAIRVTDAASGESVDIRDLPDIVAEDTFVGAATGLLTAKK